MSGEARPYKGLGYYGERDWLFFFGRESETAIVAANLIAARLTLVYGPSGVGKSSLLRAGVARELRQRAQESIEQLGVPGAVVVVFPEDEEGVARRNSWRDDPAAELAAEIERAVTELGIEVEPVDRSLPFAEVLKEWGERLDGDVLLILDQFEEFFLYHGDERGRGSFFDELSRALNRSDVGANVLISIREDAYSKLDSFKGRLSFLYDNYVRVDQLDRESARAAIRRPIDRYNELLVDAGARVSIEDELVEAVLDDVQAGQLVLGQTGAGAVAGNGGNERIETPFLQLVLERLWDEEVGAGSHRLRLSTLERLGGGERIVRTHLDAAMAALTDDEKELAAHAFRQLVTPSGTKIAHLPSDLADLEAVPRDRLAPVLDQLAAARILRPIAPPPGQTEPRYEIFHDVLAPAVLDWRARYLQERASRRRKRLLTIGGSILSAFVIAGLAAAGLIVWKLNDRTKDAEDKAFLNEALAAQGSAGVFLAHAPLAEAVFSPGDGRHVLTAAEDGALGIWSTAGASGPNGGRRLRTLHETGLHSARYDSSGRFIVVANDAGVAVWSLRENKRMQITKTPAADAVFNRNGRRIAAAGLDGTTSVVNWRTLRTVATFAAPGQSAVRSVRFNDDGRLLATASDDGYARVWSFDSQRPFRTFRASEDGTAYAASFSRTGRYLVTGGQDGTLRVWDVPHGRRLGAFATGPRAVLDAAFSPDEKFIVAAYGTLAGVWVRPALRQALVFRGHSAAVSSAVFNSTKSLVLTAGDDGTARLWSVVLPDLKVELQSVGTEPNGRSVRTNFNVTNIGGATSVAARVRLSSPGLRPLTLTVPPLRAGAVYPVEADLHIRPGISGAKANIRVDLNPGRRAVESDYGNNSAELLLERPDLAVETIGVAPRSGGRAVVVVEVRNIGGGDASKTTVVSHPRGYTRASVSVPPLSPHERRRVRLTLQAKPGAPAQQAEVVVDPDGGTGDENRANNSDLTQPLPAYSG